MLQSGSKQDCKNSRYNPNHGMAWQTYLTAELIQIQIMGLSCRQDSQLEKTHKLAAWWLFWDPGNDAIKMLLILSKFIMTTLQGASLAQQNPLWRLSASQSGKGQKAEESLAHGQLLSGLSAGLTRGQPQNSFANIYRTFVTAHLLLCSVRV